MSDDEIAEIVAGLEDMQRTCIGIVYMASKRPGPGIYVHDRNFRNTVKLMQSEAMQPYVCINSNNCFDLTELGKCIAPMCKDIVDIQRRMK